MPVRRHERRHTAVRGSRVPIGQQARRTDRPLHDFVNPLLFALAREAGGSRGPVFRDILTEDNDLYDVGCCTASRNYETPPAASARST